MQGSRVRIPHEPVTVYAEQTSDTYVSATVVRWEGEGSHEAKSEYLPSFALACFPGKKQVEYFNIYNNVLYILVKSKRTEHLLK